MQQEVILSEIREIYKVLFFNYFLSSYPNRGLTINVKILRLYFKKGCLLADIENLPPKEGS